MKKKFLAFLANISPFTLFAMNNTPPSCKGCCGNCPGGCCACAKFVLMVVLGIGALVAWWFLKRK